MTRRAGGVREEATAALPRRGAATRMLLQLSTAIVQFKPTLSHTTPHFPASGFIFAYRFRRKPEKLIYSKLANCNVGIVAGTVLLTVPHR